METQDKEKKVAADKLIRQYVMWSMGAGAIPVPIADFFAVSAVQMDMIRRLSIIYEVDFRAKEGKAMITSMTSAGIARLGARLVKFIPGVGTVIGAVTSSVLSGATTYALGHVFRKHFDTGGTILDFDPKRAKSQYDELFEKGKQYVKEVRKDKDFEETIKANPFDASVTDTEHKPGREGESTDIDTTLAKLRELMQMKESGAISEEEFQNLKKKVI